MEKILIIRSCNMPVFYDLMNNIEGNEEQDIYCLTQSNIVDQLSNKYPNLKLIVKDDNKFDYKEFKCNKEIFDQLNKIKFDKIYIPSSDTNFVGFDQIFMIASKIKTEEYLLFNLNCEIQTIKLKFYKIVLKNNINNFRYFILLPMVLILIGVLYLIMYPYTYMCKFMKKR